jgi:organic hydroperoxide reductase OsmC/OhrA
MGADLTITVELQKDYKFQVNFGNDWPRLVMDEPQPLGDNTGPNAVRVVAAAVGNCLSASALYCLRRAHIDVLGMTTTVTANIVRNEKGRLRIGGLVVRIEPVVQDEDIVRMRRCLEIFEDFCVVTESVRNGIDVRVAVDPGTLARRPAGVRPQS